MVEELHRVQEHSRSATNTGDDVDERHIDLVLLPELSVHPNDVHVVDRFVDRLRCLCFCGIVFEPLTPGSTDLVNSGLWFVPEVTAEGRQIHHIRQGKWNLAPSEKALPGLIPYRPAQWLIELRDYPHWDMLNHVTLTGSICYDATDIALATDLRDLSDLFVISALNQDTATFDNMAAALHYHMFQHVAVVNTGEFGGSTIQAPYKDHFKKIVVHHHGGQQVTVAVVDLDLTVARLHRATKIPGMKHPPAPFTVATPTN